MCQWLFSFIYVLCYLNLVAIYNIMIIPVLQMRKLKHKTFWNLPGIIELACYSNLYINIGLFLNLIMKSIQIYTEVKGIELWSPP